MHFEWERLSDNFRAPQIETRERDGERERGSEGICADSTVQPLVIYFSKQQMHQRVNVV